MPFVRIGEVEGTGAPAASWDRVVEVLREEAAKLGGHAVIIGDRRQEFRMVDRTLGPLFEKRLVGVVIRFRDGAGLPAPASVAPALSPASAEISGTYHGAISANASGRRVELSLTVTVIQSGASITGVWATSGGGSGTLAGTLDGDTIPGFRAIQVNPCPGEFQGVAVVENSRSRLRGHYIGRDCQGSVEAEFVAERQL